MKSQNKTLRHLGFIAFAFAGLAPFSAQLAQANTTVYWDTDGATAGAGTAGNANGTWDESTTSNWTTDSTGSVVKTTYATANGASPSTADVVFSAGTNATSTNIILSGAVVANSITVEELLNITSATSTPSLTLGGGGVTINSTVGANTTTWISTLPTILSATQNWTNNASGLFTVNGTITGAASTAVTFGIAGTGNTTLAGIIANGATGGTVALTKTGSGTLILGAVNTYTGGTTINAGTLQINQTTGAAATGTFSLGGGTLAINAPADNYTYAPAINLTADSTFSNIGVKLINYTGALTGNSHALNVNSGWGRLYMNGTVSGITQFNVTSGAMGFDLNNGNRGGGADVVVSSGASLYFANANTTLANNITLNGGVGLGGNGALYQEGNANSTLSGTLTLNSTSTSTIGGGGTGIVNLTGKVTGSGGLTKIGSNTYILKNSGNDYSGATTIAAGTLTLDGNTGVLPSNATIIGGGGTFNYQGATAGSTLDASGYTLSGDLSIQSTYGTSGNTQVTLANATRTAGNTFNYATSGGANGTTNKIVFSTAPSTGVLLDKGLFFNGSNYAVYDTSNLVRAYNYSTDPNGATSTGGATLGSVTGKNVDLTTAAVTAQTTDSINTLRLGTTNGVTMASGQTLTVDGILKSGGNAATITGGTGIQASSGSEMVIRTNASGDTLTINTPILANGASSLTKSGAGTAVLLSSNTYTGGTTVAGGTLQVGNSTTNTASGSSTGLGAAGSTVTVNAGTLRFQMGGLSNNAFDENFVFNANSTLSHGDGKLTFGSATVGTASNSRTIMFNGSTTLNPLWTQKQFVMAGIVQGSGDINIVRPGASNGEMGYVAFVNDTNTYSGTITTSGVIGTNAAGIIVGTANTLQHANVVNNTFNLTGNTLQGLVFQTTSANLGSLAGAGDFILGQNTGAIFATPSVTTSSTAVALTVGGSNASTTYSGHISGLGSITKTGSGTMTLSGANTYNGTTTIDAGKLLVSGSIGSSAVTVSNTGSTLASGSTGTIGSSFTINSGSILAAGDVNAVGKATVGMGASSLASGSIFSWDLASNKSTSTGSRGTDFDALDVTSGGTLAVDSGAIFRVVLGAGVGADSFWQSNQSWSDIFNGTLTGSFTNSLLEVVNTSGATYDQDSLFTGSGYHFTISGSTLNWSAVPEPTSALAGLLIGAGLLRRRKH